jgi:2-amino-4-hydroxy-6-hydroxymethyldihydropteridine diphosphokinase
VLVNDVYIGFGSNLGNPERQIEQALGLLETCSVAIDDISSLYRTEPVDAPTDLWFLNGVARASTRLAPLDLLEALLTVEKEMGRQRIQRNDPRTIDLDLLLVGDLVMDEPGLTLPHPRFHLRRFVLVPLVEIAPHLVHPRLGVTAKELLSRCLDTSAVHHFDSLVVP